MNIRQLEAFRATMRTGSITGAAEVMHITQPSVSRLIADLQSNLGFELFIRSGRGLVATVEARRFYRGVESMFVGTERLEEIAETIRNTAGGVVTLGTIQALCGSVAARSVSELYRALADVRITTYVRNTPAIVDAVQMQQFDLGLVGRSPPYDGVELLQQVSLPYVCVLPASHSLAESTDPINLAHISKTEQVVTFAGSYPDEMPNLDREISERLRRNSRLAAANMPMAMALAKTAGIMAIVDPISASEALKGEEMVVRPILQNLNYHIGLVTRGLDSLSAEARKLADLLMENLSAAQENAQKWLP